MSIERTLRLIMFSLLLASALPAWAQRGAGRNVQRGAGDGIFQSLLDSIPMAELSSNEAAELTYLREEEKLARDVYLALYSKWGASIFWNISLSEDRHTNALKLLLDRYGLPDPAENKEAGVFEDPALKELYSYLVAQGETSLSAALRVGATIEDLDYRDLDKALSATDNDDLIIVYRNLQNGTQNHMRAFVGQLEALGESYVAQYMDDVTLEEILSISPNRGMGFGRRRNSPQRIGSGNGVCPLGNNLQSN